MKDIIFKLRNGKDYYILEEIFYNNKKYALATEYYSERNEINEEQFVIMEVKIINDELIVDEIYDDNIAEEVATLFKNKIQKNEE